MASNIPAAPFALLCELKHNPLGIGRSTPRLSWQMRSLNRGARQIAYQIMAASSEEHLASQHADLWESGKISSDASVHVEYGGQPLTSRRRSWWMVRVWDENDALSEWSESAWWETGLFNRDEWTGSWIGGALEKPEQRVSLRESMGD